MDTMSMGVLTDSRALDFSSNNTWVVRSFVRMNDKDATRMQSYTLLWPVRFAERGAAAG